MRLGSAFPAVVLLLGSLAARADVVYTYTGNAFTTATGAYTPADFVTGSFTVADPIVADTASLVPLSFSFSDGVQTINSSNATYEQFIDFDPNPGGGFAEYSVILYTLSGHMTLESLGTGLEYDAVQNGAGVGRVAEAGSFILPGSSVTPEPSSFALLCTGLLGLAGLAKRRWA